MTFSHARMRGAMPPPLDRDSTGDAGAGVPGGHSPRRAQRATTSTILGTGELQSRKIDERVWERHSAQE